MIEVKDRFKSLRREGLTYCEAIAELESDDGHTLSQDDFEAVEMGEQELGQEAFNRSVESGAVAVAPERSDSHEGETKINF